jgi:hypothetical protein
MAMNDGDGRPRSKLIPWLIGGLIILTLLFFALRGCTDTQDAAQDTGAASMPSSTATSTPAAP